MVTPLVIDEIAWSIRKTYPQNIRTTIKAIYTNPKIRVESIHASAGIEMLDIMEKHNLKPRDALHVAVMLANNETEILSNDPDFDCVPGITRIGF
jgi:predicted nucleic acid-binding protein